MRAGAADVPNAVEGQDPRLSGPVFPRMDERVDRQLVEEAPLSRPVRLRRSGWRWLGFAALLLLIGLGLWLGLRRSAQEGPARPARTAAQPVGAATIGTGDIRVVLNELGTVSSLDTVTVKTQINGPLTEIAFKEGQIVKKGDFLAQIDPRPYQAALERDQGLLARDQGLLAQAKSDLQRYITLGRQDSIAQQQVQDQRYLVEQDTGTVKQDQGTVNADQVNLAYCHIVSPIDGRVGLRQVDQGNFVQTTDTNGIVVITQEQPISVVFSVPEDNLPEIAQRLATGAELAVEAYDRSNTILLDQGKLATVDNQVDTTTGTVKMRALFSNTKNELFPNQFVNAHLLVDTLKNVVRVPVPAVQVGAPGNYVWVIGHDGTVKATQVKLGPVDGQFQQVISGLSAGEQVVTDGTDRLRDGMRVVVSDQGAVISDQGDKKPAHARPARGATRPPITDH